MKIIIDARILPTGTGRYVERLLHYLQNIDNKNDYVVLLEQKGYDTWQPRATNFKKELANYSIFGLDGQLKLAKHIRSLNPDLVHFTFQQTALPYKGRKIVSILDLTQLRFKNIRHGSSLVYSAKQRLLAVAMRRSARTADHVITISNFVKSDIIKFFKIPSDKVSVTYCAAEAPDPKVLPEPIKELKHSKYIAYVGNAIPHKNLPRLIEAFQLLQESNPDIRLVLAGKTDDNYRMLQSHIRPSDSIVFTDYISDEQLYWLYKNALAIIVPSLSEGFGMPGLEAMQHGCPVISSNATCLPEIYGDAAAYFDPYNINDITHVIDMVLKDEDLRKDLIKKGQAQVKKYSWEKMARQTMDIYNNALKNS